jgi:hypothetical protein
MTATASTASTMLSQQSIPLLPSSPRPGITTRIWVIPLSSSSNTRAPTTSFLNSDTGTILHWRRWHRLECAEAQLAHLGGVVSETVLSLSMRLLNFHYGSNKEADREPKIQYKMLLHCRHTHKQCAFIYQLNIEIHEQYIQFISAYQCIPLSSSSLRGVDYNFTTKATQESTQQNEHRRSIASLPNDGT